MVLLRETIEQDIPEIYRYIHVSYVTKYCDDPEKQWKTHEKWYKFLINSDSYVMYTITNSENGQFYGCVKFELEGECAIINVYLIEEIRHKGYSEKIIELSIGELQIKHPEISIVLAYILEENTPSLSAFKHLKFQYDGVEEYKGLDHMLFIKTLK